MRAWGWSLLAVLPLTGQTVSPLMPAAPCAVGIEVEVTAPLRWGAFEWRLFTSEVEHVWAPYGLSICWRQGANGCEGAQVRLRVLVAETLPPARSTTPTRAPVVGRIMFDANGPATDITLSLEGGRYLVARATLGGRPIEAWPGAIAERLVPIVLGRALAHEIGHFVLRSRQHSRSGLMAARFWPDEVTFGSTSAFHLSPEEAATIRCEGTSWISN
jgi:hypothetical protein